MKTHQNCIVRILTRLRVAIFRCVLAACASFALPAASAQAAGRNAQPTAQQTAQQTERTLSGDDGLAVIAAALNAKVRVRGGRDCSHLLHAIYQKAGFPYAYASSTDLYAGVDAFRRVSQPQPGDLIVWRGHSGIVVQPSRHIFFSFMSAGPSTDDYQSPYWSGRGRPRFYRYIKGGSCAGCASVSSLRRPH
jgi:cell wall-associated NlpC family hydrolase